MAEVKRAFQLNGKLKHEYYVCGGIMEGPYREYDKDGNLYIECNYLNGKIEGEFVVYFRDNCVKSIYVNGIKHGTETVYYDDGTVHTKCTYVDGKEHGLYTEYYKSGNIMKEFMYVNGEKEGVYIVKYDNGNMQTQCTHVNGILQGDYKQYSEDGQLISNYKYIDGHRDNTRPFWETFPAHDIFDDEKYAKGAKKYIDHEEQQTWIVHNLVDGKPHGKVEKHSYGKHKIYKYKNGKKVKFSCTIM